MTDNEIILSAIVYPFLGFGVIFAAVAVFWQRQRKDWHATLLNRKLVRWQMNETTGETKLVWVDDGTDVP